MFHPDDFNMVWPSGWLLLQDDLSIIKLVSPFQLAFNLMLILWQPATWNQELDNLLSLDPSKQHECVRSLTDPSLFLIDTTFDWYKLSDLRVWMNLRVERNTEVMSHNMTMLQ